MRVSKLALLLLAVYVAAQIASAHSAASGETKPGIGGFGLIKEKITPAKRVAAYFAEKIDLAILASDSDAVNVIVQADDVKGIQASEKKKFAMGNFYSIRMNISEITKLEKSSSVRKVWLEKTYKPLLDVAVPLINASVSSSGGYNGSGVKVCVIDTGVNSSHPALASRIVAERDFVTTDIDGNSTADYSGHGTHVAGIVASSDSVYRGVAPGASILNAKVFSSTSNGAPESAIMSGIDWCIEQGADILTMSLGGAENPNDGSDALSQYVNAAVDSGVTITVAAGNDGPGSGTVACPGCAHKAVTVGSTKKSPADAISSFSSRGPAYDGRIKPDVTAPGQTITSAYYTGGWASMSGTSMATPMVAGLAALALQARNMTPAELKALLMNTAVDLGEAGKDNAYGAGRINGRLFAEINNTLEGRINSEYKVHDFFVNGSEIRATLYWPENFSKHNDLDLYLLDPSGDTRASSTSQYNTDEMVSLQNPSPYGYWRLLVDPYDVNGSQTYAIASNLEASGDVQIKINNASGVVYHRINASDNATLRLGWNSSANLDLYLYNATGNLANYSVLNNTNYEVVTYSNPEPVTWLARIVNLDGIRVQYSLTSSSVISEQITDAVPPGITISEPFNTTYNSSSIAVSFSATDDFASYLDCSVAVYNSTQSLEVRNGSMSAFNFSVSDGSHNVTVTCTDWSNNLGNATAYFTVNATPTAEVNPMVAYPAVTFTGGNGSAFSPNDDGVYDSITFNVTAGETVNFSTTYLLASNGSKVKRFNSVSNTNTILKEWNGSCTSTYCNGIPPDGVYRINITTVNPSGDVNSTILSQNITVDTTPMSMSFTYPTPNNENLPNSSVTVNITTREAPASLFLEWNGTNVTMNGNGTSWYRTFGNLYGNYTFRAHARDSVYNWNVSETRRVYLNYTINASGVMDRLNQTVSGRNITVILTDADGNETDEIIPTERYTISFNVSGMLAEMDFLGADLNTSAAANITDNITGESNLSQSFTGAGGILDGYVWVDMNNLLPEGNFTPKVRFPLRKLYFYINGTRGAPNSTRITNACNVNASNVPCYNASGTGATLYLSSFSGAAAGNDTQAPALSASSPTAIIYSTTSVPVNYSVSDNVAVDACWYQLNSNANTTLTNCTNATITASEGSNTLSIYVNDTSGNRNQTTVTFTVSTATPTPAPDAASSSGAVSDTVSTPHPTQTPKATPRPSATPVPTPARQEQSQPHNTEKNQTANRTANATSVPPATGFITRDYGNFVAGFAASVLIIGAAWLWKSKHKVGTKKRRELRRKSRIPPTKV